MKCITLALLFCCFALPATAAGLPDYNAKTFCEQHTKRELLQECLQEEAAAFRRLMGGIQGTDELFEKCRATLNALGLESYAAFEHCLKKGDGDM